MTRTHPPTRTPLLAALFLSGCTTLVASLVSDAMVDRQLAIVSYRGTFTETYADATGAEIRLVKRVTYQRPGRIRVEVLEPEARRGELILFDGGTLILWSPATGLGVRIDNLAVPSEPELRAMAKADALWSVERYSLNRMGEQRRAGHLTGVWQATPTRHAPLLFPYRSWTDERHAMPLALEIEDRRSHTWYAMGFDELEYGVQLAEETFAFSFPSDASVLNWNTAAEGLDVASARAALPFDLLLPEPLPAGWRVAKVVTQNARAPMALVLLEKADGRQLALTETFAFARLAQLPGIPVTVSGEAGALTLAGNVASVSWYAGQTALTLVGRVPYPELVALAATIRSPDRSADANAGEPGDGAATGARRAFRARLTERYADGEPLVKRLRSRPPTSIRSETLSPPQAAGDLIALDATGLQIWLPRLGVGVRFRGLEPPSPTALRNALTEDGQWWLRNFDVTFEGVDEQDGRQALHWRATPRRELPLHFVTDTWLDRESGAPLRLEIRDRPDHLWYSAALTELSSTTGDDAAGAPLTFPESALVFEWDFGHPGLTSDEATERLGRAPLIPQGLPWGLSLAKIIPDSRGLPTITLLFRGPDGGRWLTLTEARALGRAATGDQGIRVPVGPTTGRLTLAGTLATLSWSAGGTALTLTGNLPFAELVRIAAELTPSGATATAAATPPDADLDPFGIDAYRARARERRSDTKQDTMREIIYDRGRLRAVVTSPRNRAGELFLFDGETVSLWWPQHLLGVRIAGVDPPTAARAERLASEDGVWLLRHYDVTPAGRELIGDRDALHFRALPRAPAPFLFASDTWLDAERGLPLKLELWETPDRLWYGVELEKVAFAPQIDDDAFAWRFPSNAVVFAWDLRDPGQPASELRRSLNFALALPNELPEGIAVSKIIRGRHALPMAMVIMRGRGRLLTLTEVRRTLPAAARGGGLAVALGERSGYVNVIGNQVSVTWDLGNTALTLLGDLPLPEVIQIAAGVAPAK